MPCRPYSGTSLFRLLPWHGLQPSSTIVFGTSALSHDGGTKWRDCIMVSLTVHGRSLTAYPFTCPCPSSAAAALLAQLHSPKFQGLAAVLSFSFPCGQVCLPILAAVAASWPWFHPFSYPSLQIIHGVLFIFQISPTSIFLCKVSASGVPQGPPSGTCLVIFFKFLGCGCS